MLHVGGVHDAVTVEPPALGVVAEIVSLVLVLQLVPTLTDAGSEEHQVRGTPVIVAPRVSTTVAVMVLLVPFATVRLLLVPPVTASVMDSTAQVAKVKGTPVTPLALANIEVVPGVRAVNCPWLAGNPTGVAFNATTLEFNACQVKVPTDEVISVPRLKAWAS